MLDTTAPCTCCADVWTYIAYHIDPDATLSSDEDITALYADLTAWYAAGNEAESGYPGELNLPITSDHLRRYIKGDY